MKSVSLDIVEVFNEITNEQLVKKSLIVNNRIIKVCIANQSSQSSNQFLGV